MPQHLTQTPASAGHALDVNGRKLIVSHEQIVSILRSRLGQAHGDLLAMPKPLDDGGIEWSTRRSGPVVPASALPPEERDKLQRWADRLLNDIRSLGETLLGEGQAPSMVGHMLKEAIRFPAGDWLYSVDAKPVMVMWGHAATAGTSVPWVAPPAAVAVAPIASGGVPPLSSPEPVVAPAAVVAQERRGMQRWLLGGLLLLALVAALLFGLKTCSGMAPRDGDYGAKLGEADAANKKLEEEIARTRAQTPQFMCVRPPDEKPPAPVAEAAKPEPQPEPEPPQQAEAPKADPYEALATRVGAAKKDCKQLQQLVRDPLLRNPEARAQGLRRDVAQALQQNCKEEMIKEARNMCPGQRPKELAPEMVLVFDASGSMAFSADATDQEIQQMSAMDAMQGMMKQFGLGGLGGRGGGAPDMSRLKREPTRITAARQAAVAVVRKVPSDTSIGLVLVDQCPAARSAGFYPPARRGELISGLQSVQPQQGTPLADGVAKGGQLVDGVSREALMVVISDGRESCGQDPCAVGRALARAKPHLKINVVDILGTGAGNCLAQATGGRVFTARNAGEVAAMTRRAAEDAMGPASCTKP